MPLREIILGLSVITSFSISYPVAKLSRKDTSSYIFLALICLMMLWLSTSYLVDKIAFDTLSWNKLLAILASIFGGLSILVSARLSLGLHKGNLEAKNKRMIFLSSATLIILGSALPGAVGEVSRQSTNLVRIAYGPLNYLWVIGVLISIYILSRTILDSLKNPSSSSKLVKPVSFGVVNGIIVGLSTNFLVPIATSNYQTVVLAPLVAVLLSLSFGYAIAAHKLFNLRASVFRAAGYSLSIATLVLMYSLIIYGVLLPIIKPGVGFKLNTLLLLTGGIAATIYFYDKIKLVFDTITERLFFKSNYSLPKFLDELNQALINSGGVEELASSVMNVIGRTLKTDFLVLAVKNDEFEITIDSRTKEPGKEIFQEEVAPFLATYHLKESQRVVLRDYIDRTKYKELYEILLKKDMPIAIDLSETSTKRSSMKRALEKDGNKILFLGPKKSGESYNVQDFDALRIISKELVIALQNSIRFEEIKLFNLELQHKVEVATIKLRQQNKKLVQADELKDDFLSIASHQMRTPISTILGYTSILNSGDAGKMSKDQEKFSKIVESSTKRLAYLINDFLTVSRLKSGKFSIEKIETDLKVALKEEVVDLEHQFESKNVKLNVHIDGHVPMMRADEQKLRQVMMNLMDNALHYTPSGGKVEVTMKMDGKQVCFEVKDNGIGVPKAEQAKLFSKMFRAGNAQKMRPDGTGLGLYLAKKVVLGHGGHIIFNSKEGEGSTFGFKLPLK